MDPGGRKAPDPDPQHCVDVESVIFVNGSPRIRIKISRIGTTAGKAGTGSGCPVRLKIRLPVNVFYIRLECTGTTVKIPNTVKDTGTGKI
jgi:hypothetical protein